MSASVPVGALIGWMLLLTVKHVIADFVLQTSWMAIGKDQRTGWALPLLAHCLVHLAVAMALILIVAPQFWFVALIDFAIHITIDRAKGFCASQIWRDAGASASLVLDADRGGPGAASPDRFRSVDIHGRERLILRAGGRAVADWMKAKALRSMIRKSGNRFSLATNAERVCLEIMLQQMIEPIKSPHPAA